MKKVAFETTELESVHNTRVGCGGHSNWYQTRYITIQISENMGEQRKSNQQ